MKITERSLRKVVKTLIKESFEAPKSWQDVVDAGHDDIVGIERRVDLKNRLWARYKDSFDKSTTNFEVYTFVMVDGPLDYDLDETWLLEFELWLRRFAYDLLPGERLKQGLGVFQKNLLVIEEDPETGYAVPMVLKAERPRYTQGGAWPGLPLD